MRRNNSSDSSGVFKSLSNLKRQAKTESVVRVSCNPQTITLRLYRKLVEPLNAPKKKKPNNNPKKLATQLHTQCGDDMTSRPGPREMSRYITIPFVNLLRVNKSKQSLSATLMGRHVAMKNHRKAP